MKTAIVIGSGFSGLATASFLAKAGWKVTVVEKHHQAGGRGRKFEAAGFTFDMGPSWYWMPDVFDRYFAQFGKKTSDYYQLERLDPSYRVYWPDTYTDIPAGYDRLRAFFESLEPGSGAGLDEFLREAKFKYEVGMHKLVFKPGLEWSEFLDADLAKGVFRLDVFKSMSSHIRKYFKHPKLIQLLEFPVLFLGALPQDIPALYSLMNFADLKLGTWYPEGGMWKIGDAMFRLALELGVDFKFGAEVRRVLVTGGKTEGVEVSDQKGHELLTADVVVASADYHHVETELLPAEYRSYSDSYWEKRVMAPACLLYYVGLNKKLKNVLHHNLFFDSDFGKHGEEIYKTPRWPSDPLFYACIPSVTDGEVAPEGMENLFLLIPVAAGLEQDSEEVREKYFEQILERLESRTNQSIKDAIVYKRSYSIADFKSDYGAFKGNAYGLANTLMQTAILKPSCRSSKIKNLFFTGQLTVPGPGVPPSLISGEVVASEVLKDFS